MEKKLFYCDECEELIGDYVEQTLQGMNGERFPLARGTHFCSEKCRDTYNNKLREYEYLCEHPEEVSGNSSQH